jgi:hypothetical protein
MAITRFASASAALLLGTLALASGCDKTETVPGADCESQGGIMVDVDGASKCVEKCDSSKCPEGNACVGNVCMLTCELHSECYQVLKGDGYNQRCAQVTADSDKGLNDGDTITVCQDTNIHPQAGMPCPMGDECNGLSACPNGSPCEEANCPAAECKPMRCISLGLEDAEAYCTTVDCKTDDDCLAGLTCGVLRVENQLCGNPDKGTEQPCIDPANNAAVGGTYQEGPTAVLQNTCVKREPCSPCVEARDCSTFRSDLACVTVGTDSVCAETCFNNDDCPDDFECYGAAAPTFGYCIPRTQTCKPPASNNFCYNCINDLDCGPAGPGNTIGCLELNEGQKGCFDFSFPTSCTTDTDCPLSPGGRPGECLDDAEGVPVGDPLYHKCYAPLITSAGGFQCWTKN